MPTVQTKTGKMKFPYTQAGLRAAAAAAAKANTGKSKKGKKK